MKIFKSHKNGKLTHLCHFKAQAPPGNSTQSPSELYWNQLDNQGSRTGENDFG